MPTPSEASEAFRKAIAAGDVDAALGAARSMDYVGLGDSLELVRLLARQGDSRFDRAANRWLSRWVIEKGASAAEVSIAATAIGALAVDPDSEAALGALRLVLRPD